MVEGRQFTAAENRRNRAAADGHDASGAVGYTLATFNRRNWMPGKRARKLRCATVAAAENVRTRVDALARNVWWSWNPDPPRLFAALDPAQWEANNHNPVAVLAGLPAERRAALAADPAFAATLSTCERQLRDYLRARTWFARTATPAQRRLRVAYFCAEFGLHEALPIYAGGLGVLAGDHLKSASDLGIPLVGVGLLYRHGYYRQELGPAGATRAIYPVHDFTRLPLLDTGRTVDVPLGPRSVRAKIWRVQVGRVPLYLLDTDHSGNPPRARAITRRLYGGDPRMRIEQEILLGVGGTRALVELGERATVFHLNEGHAAFAILERLSRLRVTGLSFERALERVRRSTVFTTHTPVAAGHDRFPPALLRRYFAPLVGELGIDQAALLSLGREDARDRRAPFCMTVLALRGSARCNGVSRLHGAVSRAMWTRVYAAQRPANVPIGHITNGVHAETWLAPEMRPLYDRYLKPRWIGAGPDDDWWRHAERIPPAELWQVRNLLRRKLVAFVRARLRQQIERRCGSLEALVAALETFDEDALTIGFARRFATYKRAPLVFRDAARLARILGDARRPVQLVFAGKAHPADRAGQRFAQEVYRQTLRPGLRGRVVLLEDYDMHVGRLLTSGCDVWLNNPIRPLEASGTSGMKPPLHGGLNLSILDGWWAEGYDGRNGWAIPTAAHDRVSARERDRLEAAAIYDVLEHDVAPLFYARDRAGVPRGWLRRAARSLRTI